MRSLSGGGKCCKCNADGSCSSCICVKKESACVNCAPGSQRKCKNGGNRCRFTSLSTGTTETETAIASIKGGDFCPPCAKTTEREFQDVGVVGSVDGSQLLELSNDNIRITKDDDNVKSSDNAITKAAAVIPSVKCVSSPCCWDDESFFVEVSSAYEQVVCWKRNLFNVPYGAAGAEFVEELAALLKSFAEGGKLRSIAWKAMCVACHLLLQKPHSSGSSAVFSQHLRRRLAQWKVGNVADLLDESLCIQRHLPEGAGRRRSDSVLSDTTFSQLVFSGKIHAALRYISQDHAGGVLRLDDPVSAGSSETVRDTLLSKHPHPKDPHLMHCWRVHHNASTQLFLKN